MPSNPTSPKASQGTQITIHTTHIQLHASERLEGDLPGYISIIIFIRWAQDCHALMEFLVEELMTFLGPHQNSIEAISSHAKS